MEKMPEHMNESIRKFKAALEKRKDEKWEKWKFFDIVSEAGIDRSKCEKATPFTVTLWITFLDTIRKRCSKSDLKYQTREELIKAYKARFEKYAPERQAVLFETANWMHMFFKYIPAEKNKGLAIEVIPKLVEGWGARYVTGSGQTQATADRVLIYEREGGLEGYIKRRKALAAREAASFESPKPKKARVIAGTTISPKAAAALITPKNETKAAIEKLGFVSPYTSSSPSVSRPPRKRILAELSSSLAPQGPSISHLEEEMGSISKQLSGLQKDVKATRTEVHNLRTSTKKDLTSLRTDLSKTQQVQEQLSRTVADLTAAGSASNANMLSISVDGDESIPASSTHDGDRGLFSGQLFSPNSLVGETPIYPNMD
jgi:regulator of replication initiation timing